MSDICFDDFDYNRHSDTCECKECLAEQVVPAQYIQRTVYMNKKSKEKFLNLLKTICDDYDSYQGNYPESEYEGKSIYEHAEEFIENLNNK